MSTPPIAADFKLALPPPPIIAGQCTAAATEVTRRADVDDIESA